MMASHKSRFLSSAIGSLTLTESAPDDDDDDGDGDEMAASDGRADL